MGRGTGRGIRVGGIRREERQDGNFVVGMRGGMVVVGELCSEVGLVEGWMVFFWGGVRIIPRPEIWVTRDHNTFVQVTQCPNPALVHFGRKWLHNNYKDIRNLKPIDYNAASITHSDKGRTREVY